MISAKGCQFDAVDDNGLYRAQYNLGCRLLTREELKLSRILTSNLSKYGSLSSSLHYVVLLHRVTILSKILYRITVFFIKNGK